MKKTFKFAAIAVVASLTMIACNNNNQATEDTIDSTAIEQIAQDEMIVEPEVVADTVKEEAPAPAPATAKKPAVKKTPTQAQKEPVPTTIEKTDNVQTTVNETAKEVGKGQKVEGRKKPTTL